MSKKWMVVGAQGQDGYLLTKNLLARGEKVVALGRRRLDYSSSKDRFLSNSLRQNSKYFSFEICDVREMPSIVRVLKNHTPDIIVNFASLSSPHESIQNATGTFQNDTVGLINILEAVQALNLKSYILNPCSAAAFEASFGKSGVTRSEGFNSPYSLSKYTSNVVANYFRDSHGVNVGTVVLYNHESVFRPENFVTRKISLSAARIALGIEEKVSLWTTLPVRDWGWAEEYVEAIRIVCEKQLSEEIVISTGRGASIREFAERAFSIVGLRLDDHLITESTSMGTVDVSIGDQVQVEKTKTLTNWTPTIFWDQIAKRMVENDLRLVEISNDY